MDEASFAGARNGVLTSTVLLGFPKICSLDARIKALNGRVERPDVPVNLLVARVEEVGARVDALDAHVETVDAGVEALDVNIKALDARVGQAKFAA